MHTSISYRFVSMAAAIVLSLLSIAASASAGVYAMTATHAWTVAGIQQPSNVPWD
jgi:hypothetical protein